MSEPIKDLTAALRRLELSTAQQTVFLSLLQAGPATARTLADRTNITRPSVYDQLKSLRTDGLVVEIEEDGKALFSAVPIEQLDVLLADKIDRIERSRQSLIAALPKLQKLTHVVQPKVRFYAGVDDVKNILKDVLWNAPKEITITWPSQTMSEVFDAAYLLWFAERLAAQQLSIDLQATPGHPFALSVKYQQLKTEPAMATIVYGTRVAHISSTAEAYGFIVESVEYVALQSI